MFAIRKNNMNAGSLTTCKRYRLIAAGSSEAIPRKCFVSHRPPSREGGSVGRAKKKRMNT